MSTNKHDFRFYAKLLVLLCPVLCFTFFPRTCAFIDCYQRSFVALEKKKNYLYFRLYRLRRNKLVIVSQKKHLYFFYSYRNFPFVLNVCVFIMITRKGYRKLIVTI